MAQYESFARYYDRMMHDVDYDAWGAYLVGILGRANSRELVDCACGTGELTRRFIKAGFRTMGCDISEEMLSVARDKLLRLGLFCPLICQDCSKLELPHKVDIINCSCDGVNYLLTADELACFFTRAHASLKSGGLLLFDISTEYKLEKVLGLTTQTDIADDWAYIWRNNYDPASRLIEMKLCCFVKDGSVWKRFDERHVQRAHRTDEVVKLLNDCGFSEIKMMNAFSAEPPQAQSQRVQFMARKG